MGKSRRTFAREFKGQAAKLVTEQGRSFAQAAANLGIAESRLRKWKKDLDAQGDRTFLGKGDLPALEAIHRLVVDAAEDEERPAATN